MLKGIFGRGSAPPEPVNKFSPAYFKHLLTTLSQQLSRPSLQSDVVVTALKELGEVMVWAGKSKEDGKDVNKARTAEMFGELPVMKTIVSLHKAAYGNAPDIQQQVLQTLSIVLSNMGEAGGSLFFLLSNNYVNELIQAPFDDEDEEVLGYYVSLLKSLSVAFNESTVNFFLIRTVMRGKDREGSRVGGREAQAAQNADFPMYSRALSYADHREGMVRAAVRTLTLNVYRLIDPAVHAFLVQPPHSDYPITVAHRLRRIILEANGMAVAYTAAMKGGRYDYCPSRQPYCIDFKRRAAAAPSHETEDGSGHQAREQPPPDDQPPQRSVARLAYELQNSVADIEDELYYIQDVFNIAVTATTGGCTTFQRMADLFSNAVWDVIVQPLLLGEQEEAALDPAFRLHMLADILRILAHVPLRRQILQRLSHDVQGSDGMLCTSSGLDMLLQDCLAGGHPHVLNASLQLLHVLSALVPDLAWQDDGRAPTSPTGSSSSSSSGVDQDGAGEQARQGPLSTAICRWCTACACEILLSGASTRGLAACIILAQMLTRHKECVHAGQVQALTDAVHTLSSCVQRAVLAVREEDPISGIGLLAGVEATAGEAIFNSPVLASAVLAGQQCRSHRSSSSTGPDRRDSGRDGAAQHESKEPDASKEGQARVKSATDADVSQHAADALQRLSSLAGQTNVHALCTPWARQEQGGEEADAEWQGAGTWYSPDAAQSACCTKLRRLPFLLAACRQLFHLRLLLTMAAGPGVQPLLAAAAGELIQPDGSCSMAGVDLDGLIDDVACGAYVVDETLRLVAPPVDSIRPGNVFTLSSFPFVTAVQYPVATGVHTAPLARGLSAGLRDPLAPLTAAVSQQRRVAVVLGQSYLVLAVVLAQKQGTTGTGAAPGAAAAARIRGRAVLVAPLHCTFVTPLPDAPSIVDVRVITGSVQDTAHPGLAQDMGPWVPDGEQGNTGSPLRVLGFSLAFDVLDAPGRTVAHVEGARARVSTAKVEDILKLGVMEYGSGAGEQKEEEKEQDGQGDNGAAE